MGVVINFPAAIDQPAIGPEGLGPVIDPRLIQAELHSPFSLGRVSSAISRLCGLPDPVLQPIPTSLVGKEEQTSPLVVHSVNQLPSSVTITDQLPLSYMAATELDPRKAVRLAIDFSTGLALFSQALVASSENGHHPNAHHASWRPEVWPSVEVSNAKKALRFRVAGTLALAANWLSDEFLFESRPTRQPQHIAGLANPLYREDILGLRSFLSYGLKPPKTT